MRAHFLFFLILFMVLFPPDMINGLSLEEVVNEAVENNPEFLAAMERWEATKAIIPQVRWWSAPQFSIGFDELPAGSYSLSEARMRMYSVSQMIPFPGKLTLMGKMAGNMADMAREEYEEKKNEVVAKVKIAYYDLFFVHKAIEINNENKELIHKFAKIAETKYSVGEVSQHDVLKAQVELSLIIDDLITLEQEELPTASAKLNELLNRPPHSPLGIPDEFEIPKLNKTIEDIESLAIDNRPKLIAMKYEVEKSSSALTLAKMEYLPNFMVAVKQEDMQMAMGTETTRGIMVSMDIPLWGWRQGFGIKEKSADKRASEFSYQSIKNMVLYEVRDALAKFNASERRVNLFKTSIIPQAEQALKSASVAYETGKVDFLTLIESERILRDVKLKYYKVLCEHGKNLANLEEAVGISISQ